MADTVTGNDFLRMQNDAVNRVRQMQQRSDSFTRTPTASGGDTPRPAAVNPAPQRPQSQTQVPRAQPSVPVMPTRSVAGPQSGGLLSGLLGGGEKGITGILDSLFNGETDKLLIMGMIWLLSKENADQMLIMALLYILM